MNEKNQFPEENQENNEIEPSLNQPDQGEEDEGLTTPDPWVESEDESYPTETPSTDENPELDKETPTVETEETPKKRETPSWIKKALIWFVILALVFLSGIIVSQLTGVNPLRSSLQEITTENMDRAATIDDLESQLEAAQSELSDTKNALSDTQDSLSETTQMLAAAEEEQQKQINLFELQYNIALARVAVSNQDRLSARQSLNLAEKNLESLEDHLDADTLEIIQERIDNAQRTINNNLTNTAEELRTLSENLERID